MFASSLPAGGSRPNRETVVHITDAKSLGVDINMRRPVYSNKAHVSHFLLFRGFSLSS